MGEARGPRAARPEGKGSAASLNSFVFKTLAKVFIRYRYASMAAALAIYSGIVLVFGERLAISSNYFVILPVSTAALCFGALGGIIAGALGLPANLLLFVLLGHPEYSPASKLIAELSGLAVGGLFGFLADYFHYMEREIERRVETEKALRSALESKELLLRELHHRVKNNLSVIKSLVQLQRNRSRDPDFIAASDELIGRIFAISLVHDLLGQDQALLAIGTDEYIEVLVGSISGAFGLDISSVDLNLESGDRALQIEAAISLGLIVNEVITNALKYAGAAKEGKPRLRVSFRVEGEEYSLVIIDDGPGPVAAEGGGLGLKLVQALARSLGGKASLSPIILGDDGSREKETAGARFELRFPANFMELVSSSQADDETSPGQASPM
jgi:two-component sensor histidine kinase